MWRGQWQTRVPCRVLPLQAGQYFRTFPGLSCFHEEKEKLWYAPLTNTQIPTFLWQCFQFDILMFHGSQEENYRFKTSALLSNNNLNTKMSAFLINNLNKLSYPLITLNKRLLNLRCNTQNVSYTSNPTGEKRTIISTLVDQTHIQLTCQCRVCFKTSLPCTSKNQPISKKYFKGCLHNT